MIPFEIAEAMEVPNTVTELVPEAATSNPKIPLANNAAATKAYASFDMCITYYD